MSSRQILQVLSASPGYYCIFENKETKELYASPVIAWAFVEMRGEWYPEGYREVDPMILDGTLTGGLAIPTSYSSFVGTEYEPDIEKVQKLGYSYYKVLNYVSGDSEIWVKDGEIMNFDNYPEHPSKPTAFELAVEKLLEHEGGYVNDPDDSGGETNFGISKASYPGEDIKNLTRERAIEIYKKDWWDPYPYEGIDGKLAAKVFDISVNVGVKTAHRRFQEAINNFVIPKIKVDGIFGKGTKAAANLCDPDKLCDTFKKTMESYYRGLNKPKYLKGWLNRLYS
jgi:hypothetical protein